MARQRVAQRRVTRVGRPAAPGRANAAPPRPRCPAPDRCRRPTGRRRRATLRRPPTWASAVANTDAPAPPRPAITARTAPRRSVRERTSTASDSSATRSPSCAGRVTTRCAPTAIAACQSACAGLRPTDQEDAAAPRQAPARHTAGRLRGRATTADAAAHTLRLDGSDGVDDPHADRRRDAIDVIAQRGVGDERENSAVFVVEAMSPPCGPRRHGAMRSRTDLWMKSNLWMTDKGPDSENRVPQLLQIRRDLSDKAKDPRKRDDPRQGGRRRRSSCISPGGSG